MLQQIIIVIIQKFMLDLSVSSEMVENYAVNCEIDLDGVTLNLESSLDHRSANIYPQKYTFFPVFQHLFLFFCLIITKCSYMPIVSFRTHRERFPMSQATISLICTVYHSGSCVTHIDWSVD